MSRVEAVLDEALDHLSHARTALDDPVGLDAEILQELENADQAELDQFGSVQGLPNLIRFAIDRIDDAMRLLMPEEEQRYSLVIARDGAFVSRHFDPEDEGIDALGDAINMKATYPESVVTIVIGRVGP